jgi:hypothetical protein
VGLQTGAEQNPVPKAYIDGTFFQRNCNNNGGGFGFGAPTIIEAARPSPLCASVRRFPASSVFNQQTVTRHLSYLSTSRVRAGFLAMDNLLIYGTGGVAIGRVYFSSTTVSGITPFWRQRPVQLLYGLAVAGGL